jgi:hypothetical protein
MRIKENIGKKDILHALFFAGAMAILVSQPLGLLSVPGIGAAITGIVCIIIKKPLGSACMGILAASGSFLGQSLTFFCMSCTIAATLFLIAGLMGIGQVVTKRMTFSMGALGLVVVCVSVFAMATSPTDGRNTAVASSQPPALTQGSTPVSSDKPLVFLSPTCGGCKNVMTKMVAKDPTGKTWQPVIVPYSGFAQGEKLLKDNGYKGVVISASQPPSNAVPALLDKGLVYTGKDLRIHLNIQE